MLTMIKITRAHPKKDPPSLNTIVAKQSPELRENCFIYKNEGPADLGFE